MRTHRPTAIMLFVAASSLALLATGCTSADPADPSGADAPSGSATADAEGDDADTTGSRNTDDEPMPTANAGEDDEEHPGDGKPDTAAATHEAVNGVPVIEVSMFEFGYEPDPIELTAGEPVILRFTNDGEVDHEAMVGDAHMQDEFAASADHGDHGGAGHHGDMMAVTLAPGETADLEVVIDEPGTWYLGCHLPGHYEAGMEATVTVSG